MTDWNPTLSPLKDVDRSGTLTEQFERFHAANPHVFESIYQMTTQLHGRGLSRGSMKMIFERLRWLYAIQTMGETFRLNNNYTSYYARVVHAYDPSLEGFFEVRSQRDEYEPDLEELGLDPENRSEMRQQTPSLPPQEVVSSALRAMRQMHRDYNDYYGEPPPQDYITVAKWLSAMNKARKRD